MVINNQYSTRVTTDIKDETVETIKYYYLRTCYHLIRLLYLF